MVKKLLTTLMWLAPLGGIGMLWFVKYGLAWFCMVWKCFVWSGLVGRGGDVRK